MTRKNRITWEELQPGTLLTTRDKEPWRWRRDKDSCIPRFDLPDIYFTFLGKESGSKVASTDFYAFLVGDQKVYLYLGNNNAVENSVFRIYKIVK